MLSQLGKPIPLPGTEKWGSSENPFTVLILSKSTVASSSMGSSSSAITIESNDDMPDVLMTPKRIQRNFSTANIAVKNCIEYLDSKTITDHSKNILLGLKATIDDIQLKIRTRRWLGETMDKSKNVTLAIEDVLKSSSKSGVTLSDTLSARSPARSKCIALSVEDKNILASHESNSMRRVTPNNKWAANKQDMMYRDRGSISSSPIQILMSTVFSPLHLRSHMQGVKNGAHREEGNIVANKGSPANRSFDLF